MIAHCLRVVPVVLMFAAPMLAAEPLTKAEIAKRTKPATALVDAKPAFGSAFCIHKSGFFLTNAHVVSTVPDSGKVKLVLGAGEKSQQVLQARIVRRDKEADLALLKADNEQPLATIPLGSDEHLSELDEVIAFGFPFGVALANAGEYPNITVTTSSISSLRRDKGSLSRIQLDGAINPGNSGGPVLDRNGSVVGVVVSGIRGAGLALAIPATELRRFLERPELAVSAPSVDPKNKHEPVAFRASLMSVLTEKDDYDMQLTIRSAGKDRRFAMKRYGAEYVADAAPFEKTNGPDTRVVEIRYEEGQVRLPISDRPFKAGSKSLRLSEVRSIRFGTPSQVTLQDGSTVAGEITGIESLSGILGGKVIEFATSNAVEANVIPPAGSKGAYLVTVVASKGGKEVGRYEMTKFLNGTEPGGVEALLKGKLVRPQEALKPTSYMKVVSTAGDYIGQGKTYQYQAGDMTFREQHSGCKTVAAGGFNLSVAPPRGGILAVGEYLDAKRFPFNDASPGLDFSGNGRGSNTLSGSFAIWEFEMEGNTITKLAIDFIQYSEGKRESPLVGVVRYNSKYE